VPRPGVGDVDAVAVDGETHRLPATRADRSARARECAVGGDVQNRDLIRAGVDDEQQPAAVGGLQRPL
jgi:hypothetical protein